MEGNKCKFVVYGKELVERKVKDNNGCGRIYLPKDWIGKKVKIIRRDT